MRKLIGAAFAVGMMVASPVIAQTVYTDRASFNAATSGRTIVDFNQIPSSVNGNQQNTPLTTGGVTFSPLNGATITTIATGNQGFTGGNQYGSNYLEWQNGFPNTLGVTLPNGRTAFGFDYIQIFSNDTNPYTIIVNGVSTTVNPASTVRFFGMTTAAPITSLSITAVNFPTLDNFTYGVAGAAPEPTTWVLMILGFGIVGYAMRRRRVGYGTTTARVTHALSLA